MIMKNLKARNDMNEDTRLKLLQILESAQENINLILTWAEPNNPYISRWQGEKLIICDLISQFVHPLHHYEKLANELLIERDELQELLDKMAGAISKHISEPIGEHSSDNCPWHRAIGLIT